MLWWRCSEGGMKTKIAALLILLFALNLNQEHQDTSSQFYQQPKQESKKQMSIYPNFTLDFSEINGNSELTGGSIRLNFRF
jgi:hypothetical protein